ncbi:hypothetical protein MLDJOKPK_00214 [Salmonella phage SPAsTU]|nr:hypothetical protein STsAS_196 [Salmonella phage STsAS]AXF51112.1 hypothetical protein MLDJOKPK_00214 [Salmonella phage SPAsTU]
MQIGFFFNRHGIVFVCGIADSDGKRVRTLELDEASKKEWKEKLAPFAEGKFQLLQLYTEAASPRVAFSRLGDNEDTTHLVIFSGQPGRILSELLLQFNPPSKPKLKLYEPQDNSQILILR